MSDSRTVLPPPGSTNRAHDLPGHSPCSSIEDSARRALSLLDTHAHMIVVVPSGCWVWIGCARDGGYGGVTINGQPRRAHVVSYERAYGPVPNGLVLDHLCRVRNCVNPDHLEAVTSRINSMRGEGPTALNAQKTHCPRGHPYDEENTHVRPGGGRRCRECWRLSALARKTHCKRGHPLMGSNVRITRGGYRRCRTCESAR